MKAKKNNKDNRLHSSNHVITKSCVVIQAERIRQNIGVGELARKSGVPVGVITRIESECLIDCIEDFGRIVLALNLLETLDGTLSKMLPQ